MIKRKQRIILEYETGKNPFSQRISCLPPCMQRLEDRLQNYMAEEKRLGNDVIQDMSLMWRKANEFALELGVMENNGLGPGLWKANRGWWFRFKLRVRGREEPMESIVNFDGEYVRGYSTSDFLHNVSSVSAVAALAAVSSANMSSSSSFAALAAGAQNLHGYRPIGNVGMMPLANTECDTSRSESDHT